MGRERERERETERERERESEREREREKDVRGVPSCPQPWRKQESEMQVLMSVCMVFRDSQLPTAPKSTEKQGTPVRVGVADRTFTP